MARTSEKPPPSLLYYILCMATRLTPKCYFLPGLPLGSLEIPKIGILAILEAHNFVCKSLIEVRSKAKLNPLSSSFQRYVARHLQATKSGRFSIFSGQKSNCQIGNLTHGPSFGHNLCLKYPNVSCKLILDI
jgi:hypothetical protein